MRATCMPYAYLLHPWCCMHAVRVLRIWCVGQDDQELANEESIFENNKHRGEQKTKQCTTGKISGNLYPRKLFISSTRCKIEQKSFWKRVVQNSSSNLSKWIQTKRFWGGGSSKSFWKIFEQFWKVFGKKPWHFASRHGKSYSRVIRDNATLFVISQS